MKMQKKVGGIQSGVRGSGGCVRRIAVVKMQKKVGVGSSRGGGGGRGGGPVGVLEVGGSW